MSDGLGDIAETCASTYVADACRDRDATRRDPDAIATLTRRVATSNPTKRCT